MRKDTLKMKLRLNRTVGRVSEKLGKKFSTMLGKREIIEDEFLFFDSMIQSFGTKKDREVWEKNKNILNLIERSEEKNEVPQEEIKEEKVDQIQTPTKKKKKKLKLRSR